MKIVIKGETNQPLNEYDYEELMVRLSEIGIYEVKIETKDTESEDKDESNYCKRS